MTNTLRHYLVIMAVNYDVGFQPTFDVLCKDGHVQKDIPWINIFDQYSDGSVVIRNEYRISMQGLTAHHLTTKSSSVFPGSNSLPHLEKFIVKKFTRAPMMWRFKTQQKHNSKK